MYVCIARYVQVLKHQYSVTYTQHIGIYLLPSVDCKAGSTMECHMVHMPRRGEYATKKGKNCKSRGVCFGSNKSN